MPTSSPQISIEEDISVCSSDKKEVEAYNVLLGSPTTATCLICGPCVGISAEAQVRPCFSCVDCLFFLVASEIDPGQVPACRNCQERHLLISISFCNIPIKVGSADYLSKLAGDKQHALGSIWRCSWKISTCGGSRRKRCESRYIKQTFAALPTRVATLCGFFCNQLVDQTDNYAWQENGFELCEKHPFELLQSLPTQ